MQWKDQCNTRGNITIKMDKIEDRISGQDGKVEKVKH